MLPPCTLSPEATGIQCSSVTEMLSVLLCNRDVVTAMSLTPDATIIQCCSVTEMLSVLLPYPKVIHAALSPKCCQYCSVLKCCLYCTVNEMLVIVNAALTEMLSLPRTWCYRYSVLLYSITEMLSVLLCNRDVVTAMSLSPDATVIQCCSVTEMLSVLLPYPNVIHAALSPKCCQFCSALKCCLLSVLPVFSAALQYNRNAVSAAEIRTSTVLPVWYAQGKEKDFNHFSL
jgi:hypothetical protein